MLERKGLTDVENGTHFILFFPLVEFGDLSKINEVLGKNEVHRGQSLVWVNKDSLDGTSAAVVEHIEKYHEKVVNNSDDDKPIDYVIINCDNRPLCRTTMEGFFHGSWFRPQHKWRYYDAFNKDLPSKEVLANLKGMLIPGSYCSAYDEAGNPWIKDAKELIRTAFYEYPNIKMAGVCFGHQLISYALGGKVERMT